MQKVFRRMNKIYLIIVICLLGAIWPVSAQEVTGKWKSKPILCQKANVIVKMMEMKEEFPVIWMDGVVDLPSTYKSTKSISKFVIALNQETHNWSLIEFMNPTEDGRWEDACILGYGKSQINMNLTNKGGIGV